MLYPNAVLFRVQVVPGVLKYQLQFCSLPRGGLDIWITCYITEVGFERLFNIPELEVDHSLITTLIERWCPETHIPLTSRRNGYHLTRY